MGRPSKYATAREANEHNLYSKQGGADTGLSLEEFIGISTSKCTVCGRDALERLHSVRKDSEHTLLWNYLVKLRTNNEYVPMCKMCRLMYRHFDIRALISHCARIMAKRKWDKEVREFFQGQE